MKRTRLLILIAPLLIIVLCAGCGSENNAPAPAANAQASNTPTDIDVVKVTTQLLDATVMLPGELTPYEVVAIYPKVTGYVKTISVDRGSRVKQGELIAQLEAPELVAQRAEAESKLQTAQSQLAAAQAKLASDQGTYERLAAAAKTPGVVAGNDLQVALKTADADRASVAAQESNVTAARAAVDSISQMENYLRVTAPFDGIVIERNVHPGALVGPANGSASSVPMLRIGTPSRLRSWARLIPLPRSTCPTNKDEGAAVFVPRKRRILTATVYFSRNADR